MTRTDKVPVTVLTGFLGAGKTTLLNRILTEHHGERIAVIENEFGEIGIDQALVINADEEIFEMNNGCICCTVRGDLIRILGNLMKRRDRFDRILVETTGMADPGPVAQTFFMDDEMREMFRLDGIVTMIDAKHVALHLDESDECKEQVAFGDVIVINKMDLVSEDEAAQLEARLRGMNALARIHRSTRAGVPIGDVLDVGGFDLERALAVKPTFLEPEYPFEWAGAFELGAGEHAIELAEGPDPSMSIAILPLASADEAGIDAGAEEAFQLFSGEASPRRPGEAIAPSRAAWQLELASPGVKRFPIRVDRPGLYALYTEHLPEEFDLRLTGAAGAPIAPRAARAYAAGHTHDETVSSVGIEAEGAVDADRLNAWMGKLVREQGTDLFRMKGILNVAGMDRRYVFQGVHMLIDGAEDRPWGPGPRVNQLVFIGRNLDRAALNEGFRQCLR
ncbi:MAG TPA: GTP-binding protein [Candidatus Nanopelagicales bacterium]|nr:GTP-binding protein [Candidatus Nanopelagicales bacterium]